MLALPPIKIKAGCFATYPDYKTGHQALVDMLSGKKWGAKTLKQASIDYTPDNPKHIDSIKDILKAQKHSFDSLYCLLSDAVLYFSRKTTARIDKVKFFIKRQMKFINAKEGPPNTGSKAYTVHYFDEKGNMTIRSGGTKA